jgi:hypothetical protein
MDIKYKNAGGGNGLKKVLNNKTHGTPPTYIFRVLRNSAQ